MQEGAPEFGAGTVAAVNGAGFAAGETVQAGRFQRLVRKRMMGLEPTTFCMASRRSSQLSYIRDLQRVEPRIS